MFLISHYHNDILIIGFWPWKENTFKTSLAAGRLGSITGNKIFQEQWNKEDLAPTAAL